MKKSLLLTRWPFHFGTEQWGPVKKSHCMIMCDGDGNGGNPSDDVDDNLARKPLGSSKHCADTKLRQEKRLELWNTEASV